MHRVGIVFSNPNNISTDGTGRNEYPSVRKVKTEQEYNHAELDYGRKSRDLEDVKQRIETIRRRFNRQKAEVERQAGSAAPSDEALVDLALKHRDDAETLEQLHRQYVQLCDDMVEIRKRLE